MSVPLYLGPLNVPGFTLMRSGIRWLCEDGHACRPGEVIGFCNVGLKRINGPRDAAFAFADEARDLQIAFAARIGGRVHHDPASSHGGFLDTDFAHLWAPDCVVGHIDPMPAQTVNDAEGELRLYMMAGRRATELAECRSGLLTGWHNRSRACRIDQEGPVGTLLSIGVCELNGVIRGEKFAFLELLEAVEGPAQVVFVPDESWVPSARALSEQIRRTPAEREAIAQDLASSLAGGPVTPDAADWMFAGAILNAIGPSPLTERYQVLARDCIREVGPPDAIVMSVNAEAMTVLRHRRLGYTLSIHSYRVFDAGRAFLPWLRANFERARRNLDDVRADYRDLIDLIRADGSARQILICNRMSTSGDDDVQSYSCFDPPLGETVASVHNRDINLMLHDLARERDISIVDADAIGAELGGRYCIPDGVHQNGRMQAEIRAEILRILQARAVPGFGPAQIRRLQS